MKKTRQLIILVSDSSLETFSSKVIHEVLGFHACTIIHSLEDHLLQNVFHFNKNAVLFSMTYDLNWKKYNPIVIRLVNKATNIEQAFLNVNNIISDFPELLSNYNVDVGDHSSEDSEHKTERAVHHCLLCDISSRKTDKVEHIVYETNFFYVIPGLGAFFDGYLMIVPKKHVMSFALLPKEELQEFYIVLDDIRTILKGIYGQNVFAFECGSGRTGGGKHETSIVHAHFHLAPTDMPVLQEIQLSGLYPASILKTDLLQYGEYPYMLYVDQLDNWYISSNPQEYYPRQHPRQVLANYMGKYDIYNWRIHPFREKMDTIAEDFRVFCSTHYDSLTSWQQQSVRFDD